MISKKDFMFVVGYTGDTAIVDRHAQRKYAGLSAEELAKEGLFKPAICAALYEKNEELLNKILEVYNSLTEKKLNSVEQLKNTFGVLEVYFNIERIMYI